MLRGPIRKVQCGSQQCDGIFARGATPSSLQIGDAVCAHARPGSKFLLGQPSGFTLPAQQDAKGARRRCGDHGD
jgi:hypothetical protein